MKVLVPVKRVVDYNVKVRVKADGSGVDIANVKMSMNPFDEIACEEAIRLKESGKATEVVAVSLGEPALPGDAAHRAGHGRRPRDPGRDLGRAAAARGGQAPEGDRRQGRARPRADGQAGDRRRQQPDRRRCWRRCWAGRRRPSSPSSSSSDGKAKVSREVDEGLEQLEVGLPAVMSVDLRLNEPRYASLPNIMKAKKKPLDVLKPEDLGRRSGAAAAVPEVRGAAEAAGRRQGRLGRRAGGQAQERGGSAAMSALVLAQHDNAALDKATLHAVTAALELGPEVDLLVAGQDCGAVADAAAKVAGVRKVLRVEAPAYAQPVAEDLAGAAWSRWPRATTICWPLATTTGKNVMPRVAALLDTAQISDIVAVLGPDTFQRYVYAGNALATVQERRRQAGDHRPHHGFRCRRGRGRLGRGGDRGGGRPGRPRHLPRPRDGPLRPARPRLGADRGLGRARARLGRELQAGRGPGRRAGCRRGRLARGRRRGLSPPTTGRSARPARSWRPSSTSRSASPAPSSIWPA